MNYQNASMKRCDDLEQEVIRRHQLNKVETFYVFHCPEGTIAKRLNEVFAIRGEPWFFPGEEDFDPTDHELDAIFDVEYQ